VGVAAAIVAVSIAAYAYRGLVIEGLSLALNYARSWNAPDGTLALEIAAPAVGASDDPSNSGDPSASKMVTDEAPPLQASSDWPSYNLTLTSERYSTLHQIDSSNVSLLRVVCTYDTKQFSGFQMGPIVVNGKLIGTTDADTFAIDPATCAERWRVHEHFAQNAVNRGAAYLDGLLYRGTGDGRVVAYDVDTGVRVWESKIANAKLAETVPAAPIAWNGLVFIGNAGGDHRGSKGRMYALDAKTGSVVWEFYLVPKEPTDVPRGPQGTSPLDRSTWGNAQGIPITGGATWTSYTLDPVRQELYVPAGNSAPDFAPQMRKGANLYSGSVVVLDARTGAYKRHFELTAGDWHDWDVSNTPTLFRTRSGRRLMAVAPKDGNLYGFDLDSGERLFRSQVNRIENEAAAFLPGTAVHFCPGARGGAEWNGPAYDPDTNLVLVGSVEWCTTVTVRTDEQIARIKDGGYWVGMNSRNPIHTFGLQDSHRHWAGWIYAIDGDSGKWRWRVKDNYPVQSGITPTAGGLIFFGDMGGNFYALDARSGRKLWGENLGGAIGGGVITYGAGGSQKVAVATGFTAVLWPTKVATGKIVVLGLPDEKRG
jgi:alcohol dehydrogenase (cytochrome c)